MEVWQLCHEVFDTGNVDTGNYHVFGKVYELVLEERLSVEERVSKWADGRALCAGGRSKAAAFS